MGSKWFKLSNRTYDYFVLCLKRVVVKLLRSGNMLGYSEINELVFYLNILGIPLRYFQTLELWTPHPHI